MPAVRGQPRTSSIGDAAAATRSANDPASSRGAVTSTGRGDGRAEGGPQLVAGRDARASTTAITIALRGPTFMNVCGAARGLTQTAVISSSGASALRLTPVTNSPTGTAATRAPSTFDLGALDEERRQRVAGRRRGPEVAADRAAVADLRRADRPRRLGERRQQRRELAVLDSV